MSRYEVYTLRRTSSRTVYAIYDNLRTQPVCHGENTNRPITSTDRPSLTRMAQQFERGSR